MDISLLTDEELIRENRSAAMDLLLKKYKPMVLRASRAKFLTGGERDDLLQEGMIGLYKAIRDYDPASAAAFSTYAAVCIKHQILKAIEVSTREKNRPLNDYVALTDEEWEQASGDAALSPERILIERESGDELQERLKQTLSPLETEVLDLFLSGLDYQEIAGRTGRSPKSIDNAIQRIRRKASSMN